MVFKRKKTCYRFMIVGKKVHKLFLKRGIFLVRKGGLCMYKANDQRRGKRKNKEVELFSFVRPYLFLIMEKTD